MLKDFNGGHPIAKVLKFDCEVKFILNRAREEATDTVEHYWKVVHCLSNGTTFGHVSPPLL